MTYRLAEGVQRIEAHGGPALLSRTPLRLVRLNAPLARLLERAAAGAACSAEETRVLEALRARGLLQREPGPGPGAERLPSVSIVIPVKDRAGELRRCLASLERLRYPREKLEVLVVDDGSQDDSREVALALGAAVVPSGGRGRGPAAARNRGAALARGELLAFLDSDCTAHEGWLAELVGAFEDPEVMAVGGRVEGMHTASALDRYEAQMSSLSLGGRERSGQDGDDTFYLPSCNLLVRRSALVARGGFREELHVGEDVDLTWRLRDGGGRIVYAARGTVFHEHRARLVAFLRRRFQYGTSEGLLQRLHPARRKRLVLPPALAAGALLALAGFLAGSWLPALAGVAVLLLDALRLRRRLQRQQLHLPVCTVVRARLRAWASLGYYVAFHLVRYYGAVLLVAGLAWPRFGLLAAALALGAALVDHRVRRPALGFPAFLGFWLGEHLAYGAGVFWGCARQRTFASYRPVFSARE